MACPSTPQPHRSPAFADVAPQGAFAISGDMAFLFTMAILRIYRAGVVRHSLGAPEALRGMFLILFFVGFPTAILFEYGAIAMQFVLIGYIARRKEEVYERIERKYIYMFVAASYLAFYVILAVAMPSLSPEFR